MNFERNEDKDQILRNAKTLVDEYIDDRLIRAGLNLKPRNVIISNFLQSQANNGLNKRGRLTIAEKFKSLNEKRSSNPNGMLIDELIMVVLYIGECLELKYQHIYTDIFQHLNIRKLIEIEMKKTFMSVAEEIFNKGITWAKIISLIVFAGGLTVDCVLSGASIYVSRIKNWCVEFIDTSLKEWIIKNGGWVS